MPNISKKNQQTAITFLSFVRSEGVSKSGHPVIRCDLRSVAIEDFLTVSHSMEGMRVCLRGGQAVIL